MGRADWRVARYSSVWGAPHRLAVAADSTVSGGNLLLGWCGVRICRAPGLAPFLVARHAIKRPAQTEGVGVQAGRPMAMIGPVAAARRCRQHTAEGLERLVPDAAEFAQSLAPAALHLHSRRRPAAHRAARRVAAPAGSPAGRMRREPTPACPPPPASIRSSWARHESSSPRRRLLPGRRKGVRPGYSQSPRTTATPIHRGVSRARVVPRRLRVEQ